MNKVSGTSGEEVVDRIIKWSGNNVYGQFRHSLDQKSS